jgi:hypothetical protein
MPERRSLAVRSSTDHRPRHRGARYSISSVQIEVV